MKEKLHDIICFLLENNLVKSNTKIGGSDSYSKINEINRELLFADYDKAISIFKVTLIGKMTPYSTHPVFVYKFRKKSQLVIEGISKEDLSIIKFYTNPKTSSSFKELTL